MTPLGGEDVPPRPNDYEISFFSAKIPQCQFVEIALVRVTSQLFVSKTELIDALKNRARELGGDAIVNLATFVEQGEKLDRLGYTGTIIRFTENDCRG